MRVRLVAPLFSRAQISERIAGTDYETDQDTLSLMDLLLEYATRDETLFDASKYPLCICLSFGFLFAAFGTFSSFFSFHLLLRYLVLLSAWHGIRAVVSSPPRAWLADQLGE
jgi:hypothetical protein